MSIALVNHMWFHFVILLSILTISLSEDPAPAAADCVYTFYIQTGSNFVFTGTDSKISVTFRDSAGNWIRINNIESWGGRMGPGYDYFEAGNLDIFSGRGPCVPGPICSLTLTSDGSGMLPAWYVNYLELTTTGDHKSCGRQLFTLDTWLLPPFSLTAVKNNCGKSAVAEDGSFGLSSVVGHDVNSDQ
ncbi:OLC1v1009232C1 [Oldenlandia corymbosa var. corymbosa]|uniref:OLC1v1009232C1 n=1 Tax=Oldenlandia corymbosa var. corymbosa TaxID=529605 RepID=A0AAV1DP06_OLDCO|nr:OLC1v1009232C1 [Oldenlandia corymbosa var. corymbosa]